MRYWLETPTISAPRIELLKLSGCVTRRCRYPLPGYVNAGKKRSHGYRAAGPCSHAAYLQNLLEHSRQDAAARQKTPHEKQVKNENKPARRCRHP